MAQTIDELWSLVDQTAAKLPSYRLYHDDQGYVLYYSMDDLPGKWISITAEQFARADSHVKVVDSKIVPLNRIQFKKLVPADHGINCSTDSVAVVIPDCDSGQKWCLKTYEAD